jgi:hypothetical protein
MNERLVGWTIDRIQKNTYTDIEEFTTFILDLPFRPSMSSNYYYY